MCVLFCTIAAFYLNRWFLRRSGCCHSGFCLSQTDFLVPFPVPAWGNWKQLTSPGFVKSDALVSGLLRLRLLETPDNNVNALETNPTQCGFCNTPVFAEPRFDRDEFLDSEVLRGGLSDLEVLNSGDVGLSTLPSLSELFHATHVRPPGMVSGIFRAQGCLCVCVCVCACVSVSQWRGVFEWSSRREKIASQPRSWLMEQIQIRIQNILVTQVQPATSSLNSGCT